MPRATLKITDGQRKAIYEQVRNHLAAFGDLWLALETDRDYANAERLAVEFGEDFRLLEDLGWDPNDGRFTVELKRPGPAQSSTGTSSASRPPALPARTPSTFLGDIDGGEIHASRA